MPSRTRLIGQISHQSRLPGSRFTFDPIYALLDRKPVSKVAPSRCFHGFPKNPLECVFVRFGDFVLAYSYILELQILENTRHDIEPQAVLLFQ